MIINHSKIPLTYRNLSSIESMDKDSLKCAMDHILEAQQKGEINEDNVLYIVENVNVAGTFPNSLTSFFDACFHG